MTFRTAIFILVLALVGLPTGSAWAWGRQGHEIIANLAQEQLSPEALAGIDALRKGSVQAANLHPNETLKPFRYIDSNLSQFLDPRTPLNLSLIANWADGWRNRDRSTASWHFIDLPISETATLESEAAYCLDDACVVRQIELQAARLKDKSAPVEDRLKALFFVVHFVGDVHQPLHCANDGDRGGNDKKVKFMGRSTNLHHIWDNNIIEAQHESVAQMAQELRQEIKAAEGQEWASSAPEAWALESHALALDPIYKAYPSDGSIPDYGEDYEAQMFPIVKKQLEKAAVRLAKVLNDTFSTGN